MAVGGHGEVFDAQGVQPGDIVFHSVPDQRLSTGNANLANAQAQENAGKPVELIPRQNLVVIAVILRIGRAAIDAAKVAAVRNRDAQVRDLPAEFVVKRHWCPQKTNARIQCLEPGVDEKLHFFVYRSFPNAGGLGVSTQTLILSIAAKASPLAP